MWFYLFCDRKIKSTATAGLLSCALVWPSLWHLHSSLTSSHLSVCPMCQENVSTLSLSSEAGRDVLISPSTSPPPPPPPLPTVCYLGFVLQANTFSWYGCQHKMVLQWSAQTVIFTGGTKVFFFSPLPACHHFLASIFIRGFKVLQCKIFTAFWASEFLVFIKLTLTDCVCLTLKKRKTNCKSLIK